MRTISCLLLWLLFSINVKAQSRLSGKIIDESMGKPIPSATIRWVNQSGVVLSDSSGVFTIEMADTAGLLEIRSAGYRTRLLRIESPTEPVIISLQPWALSLGEVVVTAFEGQRSIMQTAGALAKIPTSQIETSRSTSLSGVLNTVAGVRMEESGYGGSSRVSIRGSLLRAPFGIRNIKMYWNEIPLTDASGATSRFNSLDASDIANIEIIKGPAGSLYGSGTGGVMVLQSRRPLPGDQQLQLEYTGGSFGYRRYALQAAWADTLQYVRLSLVDQDGRGYREHQRVWKQTLQLTAGLQIRPDRDLALHVFHYDGTYQLPGPLTLEQSRATPRMAIPFSKSINARVSLQNTGIALSQQATISPNWENTSSLGIVVQQKENPSGTSPAFNQHEISSFYGLSGRSVFRYNLDHQAPWSAQFGLEWQSGFSLEKYYAANAGRPGALRSDAEIASGTQVLFAQVERSFYGGWLATGGLSVNATQYNVIDRLGQQGLGGQDRLRFGPTLAPRLALVYQWNPQSALHASLSYGFSTPTQWEMKTLAGLNTELRPEQGLNSEMGWRKRSSNDRWAFDLNAYHFALKQALLPQFTPEGLPYFANAGSTRQQGIEIAGRWLVIETDRVIRLHLSGSGSWNDYVFDDYQTQSFSNGAIVIRDYSGNPMTGIAPWSAHLSSELQLPLGLSLTTHTRYRDAIPLDDAHTRFASAWWLFSGSVRGSWPVHRHLTFNLQLDGDNLTNRYWDNLLALNGTAGRYYNPGPPRNVMIRAWIKLQR
jgi:iron complex outermembrane receptor protein